jgi:hypothetical protein
MADRVNMISQMGAPGFASILAYFESPKHLV